jgi:predicted amidohydrolase
MDESNSGLKIGLVQMFCEKGDIENNLRRHQDYVVEAESKGIDILAFPEASITSYVDRNPDEFPRAVIRRDGTEIESLRDITAGCKVTVLAGFIEENSGGKPYLTQVAVRDGEIIGYYRKMNIVAKDSDWFTPGDSAAVFTHDSTCFGLAICSDLKKEDVFSDCARRGARIVFELAAPGLHDEQATRNWWSGFAWWQRTCMKYAAGYSRKYGIWIAVATQAGRTVNEDFPGGGYVFDPDGQRLFASADWSPGVEYLALDMENYHVTPL